MIYFDIYESLHPTYVPTLVKPIRIINTVKFRQGLFSYSYFNFHVGQKLATNSLRSSEHQEIFKYPFDDFSLSLNPLVKSTMPNVKFRRIC